MPWARPLGEAAGVGGSDRDHLPSQTDFKTADMDVNTDQDIEKNLVGIEARPSGPGPATRAPVLPIPGQRSWSAALPTGCFFSLTYSLGVLKPPFLKVLGCASLRPL